MTTCKRCLFDITIAHIDDMGVCEYCHLSDQITGSAQNFRPLLRRIQSHKRKSKYNCLIGISGGLDSSTLLYMAVKAWQLRPLVIHFDNGWNSPQAEHNMDALISLLGVDAIIYRVDRQEYDRLNDAFLSAGVPDADIPNDMVMTKLMYDTASRYGIKYILNGHDIRTEGSTPRGWTYMDARYMEGVYMSYTGGCRLKSVPQFTFSDQLRYAMKGITQVRPFHYGHVHSARIIYEAQMKQFIDYYEYGDKHSENLYTEFVGSYLLPGKFGIDKQLVYLSAKVRSGLMSREDAVRYLSNSTPFDLARMPSRITEKVTSHIGSRDDYPRYNFRKWRLVIWLLWKMGAVPQTFYLKYAKGDSTQENSRPSTPSNQESFH